MSLYAMIKPKGKNGLGYGSTAEDATEGVSLTGKTILVTGCNSGLGLETLRVLAKRGAHVIGTSRTVEKANAACATVSGSATGVACELADPASVRACVATVANMGVRLDGIVANAGIMALPKLERACGYELQFFTNHMGHFLLVTGLLDQLADDGRVVMLSSAAHTMAPKGGIAFDNLTGDKGYRPWTAYGQSKFANLLFAKELARRFNGTARTANAVHPGVIRTNLGRNMNPIASSVMGIVGPIAMKTIAQGAATEVYAVANPGAASISGKYFADCNVAKSRPDADNADVAAKLWKVSEEIASTV